MPDIPVEDTATSTDVPMSNDTTETDNPYVRTDDDDSFRTASDREADYMDVSEEIADTEGTGFYGATGQNLKSANWTAGEEDPDSHLFGDKGVRILGLPMFYSPLDDVNNRVYRETFEADMPVCYILPGKPIMNRKLTGNSGIWDKGAELFDSALGLLDETISLFNIKNFNDLRFISFKQDYNNYFKYLQAVLTFLHAAMDIPGTFKLSDWYKTDSTSYGLAFYLDKSTSASDSAANDYGASSLANEANQKAGQIREYKQFVGMGDGSLLGKIATGVEEIITGMIESVPVIGGLVGSFGKTLQGSQLYYRAKRFHEIY